MIRLVLLAQRLGAALPWSVQRMLGRVFGWLALVLLHQRRRTAHANIARCLPELDKSERAALVRRHFDALGIGLMEIGMAWHADDERLRGRVCAEGVELLEAARAGGRGVLLVTGHWTSLEMGCRLFGQITDFDVLYRPLGVPAFDAATVRGRLRGAQNVYEKNNVRGLFRALRAGATVIVVADQADTTESAIIAPFFGVPATNSGSPARIAAATGCAVLGIGFTRKSDGNYELRLGPRLTGFPSDDPVADATAINEAIEIHARVALEQYYWIHRRFKNAPAGPAA